jgi:hypothetical protein
MYFHSHISEKSSQNAYTTHAHMRVLLPKLSDEGTLEPGLTMWDDTDGFVKQPVSFQHYNVPSLHFGL